MDILSTFLVVFTSITLVAIGVIAGVYFPKGQKEDPRFAEALTLWQTNTRQMDELLRRNIVGLGGIRDRIDKLHVAMRDGELARGIDALIAENREFQQTMAHAARDDAPTASEAHDSHTVNNNGALAVQARPSLDELLDAVYDALKGDVCFQRMGYARIDAGVVRAVWHHSDRTTKLNVGYSARLEDSSLRFVAQQNRPRVLSDLRAYLRQHPQSHSTRLIVDEGFASSLTAPVSANDSVVGFLFLSNIQPGAFDADDVDRVQLAATQLGNAIETYSCCVL